jgi:hypothetical protein
MPVSNSPKSTSNIKHTAVGLEFEVELMSYTMSQVIQLPTRDVPVIMFLIKSQYVVNDSH